MSTLTIDVVDMSVPKFSNINIAVINKPNPVKGYTANAEEVFCLLNIQKYKITNSSTGEVVCGKDYYKYFPEKDPGGGGGGGGGGDGGSGFICESNTTAITPGFVLPLVIDIRNYPPLPDDCPFDVSDDKRAYFVDTTNDINVGGRIYNKINDHYALGMFVYLNVGYTIPLFLSPIEDAVYFTYNNSALGSFEYDGVTWYYSGASYAQGGDNRPTSSGLPIGPVLSWVNNDYVASELIDLMRSLGVVNKEVS